jgi:chromosome segregation ATPase
VDSGRATLVGGILAALVSLVGAFLARYGKRDDTATERQRLADDRRQKDIDTIIAQLRETIGRFDGELKGCKEEIDRHETTIERLRLANNDLYGEKQQLAGEVARLRARVQELEGKVS